MTFLSPTFNFLLECRHQVNSHVDFVNRITTDGKLIWPNYGLLTIKD